MPIAMMIKTAARTQESQLSHEDAEAYVMQDTITIGGHLGSMELSCSEFPPCFCLEVSNHPPKLNLTFSFGISTDW